jgi:hypothetical protein
MMITVPRYCPNCRCENCCALRAPMEEAQAALARQAKSKAKWVPHVTLDGARFHVTSYTSYDTFGPRCSEPRCEINREHERHKREARRSPWKRRTRYSRTEMST